MEVTPVSPSPASPTEGDDLCETDVTSVAIHSVTLLICLCGMVGNGAVLRLLRLKGHNAYIFDLAFADFLFLLLTFASTVLFLMKDVSCSHVIPVLYFRFLCQLSMFSCYWALFRMVYSHSMVNMYTLCHDWGIPERRLWLLDIVQFWGFFAVLTVIPAVTNLCPSYLQKHCRAAHISMYIIILLLSAAPLVIFHTINLITVMSGSKKQQLKRRDIVFFLIVLLIILLTLCNFLQELDYIVVPSPVYFLLNCIYSSIKPFIYFLAGGFQRPCSLRSLRLSLQRVFDEQKEKTDCSNDALKDTGV